MGVENRSEILEYNYHIFKKKNDFFKSQNVVGFWAKQHYILRFKSLKIRFLKVHQDLRALDWPGWRGRPAVRKFVGKLRGDAERR